MIYKSFISLFNLLDPIVEKKNCLFFIKVWIPPTIISGSPQGGKVTLSPQSEREALRRRGGGGGGEINHTFIFDVRRRSEKLWEIIRLFSGNQINWDKNNN